MPTTTLDFAMMAALILAAAVRYSSGGHADASAYLAIFALFSVGPAVMKPTALVMNIAVAGLTASDDSRRLRAWAKMSGDG